ncbi:MAG TPA: hypothetical protein VGL77_14635 [Armatimonadota bacterium]|jgi:hypothetical protein
MKPTDQTLKLRIVYLTAALSLVGFVLEIGPVGGVFSLANAGPTVWGALTLELSTLGFLAYLALAASAAVGLHLTETEPTPKEDKPDSRTPLEATSDGPPPEKARTRVRPELHQLRMLFTALGGYALLKGISLALMWPQATQSGISPGALVRALEFGFIYVALGWFVLWQFLRWYALRRRWIRLQDELLGVDVNRIIAVVLLIKPVVFFLTLALRGEPGTPLLLLMSALLHLAVVAAAALLWFAHPLTLRRTLIGLSATGAAIVLLTLVLIAVERSVAG